LVIFVKTSVLGILFKFLLIFLGGIYLLRLLSPFLFRWLFSSLVRKANSQSPKKESPPPPKQKSAADTMGEYIDYEELD
jgi:hypothetical protein